MMKPQTKSAKARARLRAFVLDRVAPQQLAFDWYRYSVTSPFLVSGPAKFLNIGTGGGLETLALLRRGNRVTTLDIAPDVVARTRDRVERNGFGDRHVGLMGHVLDVELDERFDGILMCEVLEHIKDDFRTIERLSNWLVPGGRLVMTTPTASHGQLHGDKITTVEDGGHVRVGYDGPELDAMFADAGLVTLRRVYLGHRLARGHLWCDRHLRARSSTRWMAVPLSLMSRPWMPWLDAWQGRPLCQLSLAVKRHR